MRLVSGPLFMARLPTQVRVDMPISWAMVTSSLACCCLS